MWDAVVRVKSVPVLYLPYLRYPLKDRATGFLMPQIGYAGEKGFSISQSFYWAMASNMDATVGVDFYLARGTGAGLEYRYLFPGGTKGDLNLYYFIYKTQADGTRPGSSSIVRLNHTQALPLGFTLVANVDYQTSFSFLREFDNNFQRALSYTRTSQVYLSRSWQRFNLSARASRFETYFSQLDDSNVSTSLPQISFNVFKTRLFAPVYFSLATSFSRIPIRLEVRVRGRDGAALVAPGRQPVPEPALFLDPLAHGDDDGHGQPQLLRPEPRSGVRRDRRRAALHPQLRRRRRDRRPRLLPRSSTAGTAGPGSRTSSSPTSTIRTTARPTRPAGS